jgi:putative transcriptional regulator
MSITHHPSDATLMAFAGGTLDEARSLVVASHISLCGVCRRTLRVFECVGGEMIERTEAAPMRPDAVDVALSRLGEADTQSVFPRTNGDETLPAPLAHYVLGTWRWIGPGVRLRKVDVPAQDGSRVFMLKAAPGTHLPHHRHVGTEWTCVFEGAFRYETGRFGPGDFDEADESVVHKPFVEEGAACVCLVAMQGGIALQGWLGRLLQPFIRI